MILTLPQPAQTKPPPLPSGSAISLSLSPTQFGLYFAARASCLMPDPDVSLLNPLQLPVLQAGAPVLPTAQETLRPPPGRCLQSQVVYLPLAFFLPVVFSSPEACPPHYSGLSSDSRAASAPSTSPMSSPTEESPCLCLFVCSVPAATLEHELTKGRALPVWFSVDCSAPCVAPSTPQVSVGMMLDWKL